MRMLKYVVRYEYTGYYLLLFGPQIYQGHGHAFRYSSFYYVQKITMYLWME